LRAVRRPRGLGIDRGVGGQASFSGPIRLVLVELRVPVTSAREDHGAPSRIRGTRRPAAGAMLGRIAGACSRAALESGGLEAVRRTVVADPVTTLADVADAGGGAA